MSTNLLSKRTTKCLVACLCMLLQLNIVLADNTSPLCFTARNGSVDVRFEIMNVTHTIQYSIDNINWNTYTSNTSVTINSNQSIYFRAATNQTTATAFGIEAWHDYYVGSRFYFTTTNGGKVEGSGNIMSLYGPDCPNLPLQDNAFAGMFLNCTLLTTPPDLPATTLAYWCYYGMFRNCTSLTTLPYLPATILPDFCYSFMFAACTSMIVNTEAPGKTWTITATTIGYNSLNYMFDGTSGTITSTEPTANTLYYIYPNTIPPQPISFMHPLCFTARNGSVDVRFEIKNVTHTIQYSIDSINWNTYTSNTSVTINSNQSIYFRAQTNQTTATAFGYYDSETQTYDCSHFYFTSNNNGVVESSGNIMSLYGPNCPNLLLSNYAFAFLFENDTLLKTAPNLSAYYLAKECYKGMFQGCTSLTSSPALPTPNYVAPYCCQNMFTNCTSLTQAPALPATILASYCYQGMFSGCSSLTQAPVLPATILAIRCYENMFNGCTSLTKTPELPATTLAIRCYRQMFNGCTSLTIPPILPATILPDECYYRMFQNCSSIILNVNAPGMEWRLPTPTTAGSFSNASMFNNTSGTMHSSPQYNTTYYITSGVHLVDANANDNTMGVVTGREYYIHGDTATLTATAKPHCHFVNWSNGDIASTIMIHVTGDTIITANFAIDQHILSVVSDDYTMGGVSGGGTYNYGATATLTATPTAHHHFVSWSNGLTSPTINVTVEGDSSLTAYFEIDKHNITAIPNQDGYGVVSGGGVYDYGTVITLSAIPNAGFRFVSWSNGATTITTSIIVTGDTTLTAVFEPGMYSVTSFANYSNRGYVTGSGQYDYGATATLSATPNDGYEFVGWDNGETDRVIYVTVVSDTVITAVFIVEGTAVDYVEDNKYVVGAEGNQIVVGGATEVTIYDASGKIVFNGKTDSEMQRFSVPAAVYFVRVDNKKNFKIVVK